MNMNGRLVETLTKQRDSLLQKNSALLASASLGMQFESDMEALMDIWAKSEGPQWKDSDNWGTKSPLSEWFVDSIS